MKTSTLCSIQQLGTSNLYTWVGFRLLLDEGVEEYRPLMEYLANAASIAENQTRTTGQIRVFISLRGGTAMSRLGLPSSDIDIGLRISIHTEKKIQSEQQKHRIIAQSVSSFMQAFLTELDRSSRTRVVMLEVRQLNNAQFKPIAALRKIGDSRDHGASLFNNHQLIDNMSRTWPGVAISLIATEKNKLRFLDVQCYISSFHSASQTSPCFRMSNPLGHVFFSRSHATMAKHYEHAAMCQLAKNRDWTSFFLSHLYHDFAGSPDLGSVRTRIRRIALYHALAGHHHHVEQLRLFLSSPAIAAPSLSKQIFILIGPLASQIISFEEFRAVATTILDTIDDQISDSSVDSKIHAHTISMVTEAKAFISKMDPAQEEQLKKLQLLLQNISDCALQQMEQYLVDNSDLSLSYSKVKLTRPL